MSRNRQTSGKRTGTDRRSSRIHRRVKEMAAQGLVEDQIALRLGSDKNQLRRRYIDSIKAGRDAKAAEKAEAEAAELSKSEQARLDAIKKSFDSCWYSKETGNLILAALTAVRKRSNGASRPTAAADGSQRG